MKDKLSDKIPTSFPGLFPLIKFVLRKFVVVILPETSLLYLFSFIGKIHVFLNLPISALYSVLSPFQRFIPISAFYPHFSVLSPFQRFIPISAFYPHFSVLSPFQPFSVLSPFQFPLSVSVSAIQFQRFIPTL